MDIRLKDRLGLVARREAGSSLRTKMEKPGAVRCCLGPRSPGTSGTIVTLSLHLASSESNTDWVKPSSADSPAAKGGKRIESDADRSLTKLE